jgi:hypothetical protein
MKDLALELTGLSWNALGKLSGTSIEELYNPNYSSNQAGRQGIFAKRQCQDQDEASPLFFIIIIFLFIYIMRQRLRGLYKAVYLL